MLPAAVAMCTVLLALSTNVASSLLPDEWAMQHAVWVWGATGVLGVLSVWLAVVAWRRGGADQAGVSSSRASFTQAVRGDVVGPGAVADRSVRASAGSGTVVVAGAGATVSIGALSPEPSLGRRTGQVVVGELPGAPPAFVARAAVDQLGRAFAAGSRVAVICTLTGGRGVGKTQVAAQYAREAVSAGTGLVAWLSAEGEDQFFAGLAEVADPEGDSKASAARLRSALAARTDSALVVVDNATDPQLVRSYLPPTGLTRVI